ncbi:hypothetical protein [Nonomuraea sp. NPDC003709]|uniref:hypothetical protein n=1 Tax=Nonomuraea sp. NPDC003709 TaxID=3154450 RepID=UPI0033B0064B
MIDVLARRSLPSGTARDQRHAGLLTTLILLETADRLEEGRPAERDGAALPYQLLGGHTHGRHGVRAQAEPAEARRGLDGNLTLCEHVFD